MTITTLKTGFPGGNVGPPPGQFDDRTKREIATDTASSAIYGAMRGVEAEFDGDMGVTGEALVKTLDKFLLDVAETATENAAAQGLPADKARHAGEIAADRCAKRLAACLRRHMFKGPTVG